MRNPAAASESPRAERADDSRRPAEPQALRAAPPLPRRSAGARYYVCLALLAGTAAATQSISTWFEQHLRKLPLPLKKPLHRMDKSKLLPAYELHPAMSAPLDKDTLATLGTDEYLDWRVVDVARRRADPLKVAHVLITYYTGNPDAVPHIPEECQQAGGAEQLTAGWAEARVPGVGAPDDRIELRVVEFRAPRRSQVIGLPAETPTLTVMYFFHVNGRYAASRLKVRAAQANLSHRYAYYSKIEVRFSDYSLRRPAGREESITAMTPLLRTLLPILLKDHLEDWETVNARGQGP
jgi:hypothetical protein